MTKTVGDETRKRTCLVMAVYTFLLALGAALPLAASYQTGLRADRGDQLECGGYARGVSIDEPERDRAADHPRRPC